VDTACCMVFGSGEWDGEELIVKKSFVILNVVKDLLYVRLVTEHLVKNADRSFAALRMTKNKDNKWLIPC
jgi:hypothetical protein